MFFYGTGKSAPWSPTRRNTRKRYVSISTVIFSAADTTSPPCVPLSAALPYRTACPCMPKRRSSSAACPLSLRTHCRTTGETRYSTNGQKPIASAHGNCRPSTVWRISAGGAWGALEFLPPAAEEMEQPFKVEIADLYKLAQSALNEAKDFKVEIQPDFMIESLFKVGTSAGGRRPKAIINLNPETHECYSGQVAPPQPGYIPMIIKFDEHSDIPTTRIEYSYYLMAKDAGLNMMPSYLVEGEQTAHFLTERFDRRGGKKVHVQTLAAMQPSSDSYESLFDTACRIGILPAELKQLFLLTVMNVLGGNVDDHNKNFGFLMGDDGVWHAAPAYDFTFSVDPSAPGYMNRHCMTIGNKNSDIGRGDLLELAGRYNIKGADAIIEKAIGVVSDYDRYAERAGVSGYWCSRIKEETGYRIENMSDVARHRGIGR